MSHSIKMLIRPRIPRLFLNNEYLSSTRKISIQRSLNNQSSDLNEENNDHNAKDQIHNQRFHINASILVDVKLNPNKNESYIETSITKTGREGNVVKGGSQTACSLCRHNITNLQYTDVMILSQFLEKDGKLLDYRESNLCGKQYAKVKRLIAQAQRCNLMPRPADYLVPGPWHDLNTYLEPDRQRDQPMKVIKKEYWKI